MTGSYLDYGMISTVDLDPGNEEDDEMVQNILNQISDHQPGSSPPIHQTQPVKNWNPSIQQIPPQHVIQGFTQQQNMNNGFFTGMKNDLKILVIVLIVAFIVQLIPIEKFISKYLSLDNIPYSDFLIKSILISLATVAVFKIKKKN